MVISHSYSIHNIVNFKVTYKKHLLFGSHFNRFHHEFEYFKVDKVEKPDFIVDVGPFEPDIKDCYVIEDGRFQTKENYIYFEDSYKAAKWVVEVSDIESDTTRLKVNTNFSGYFFLGSYIINFLLHIKINQKGYPLIHSSGLVKNNAAFLFPARSGSGKTIITMFLLNKGYHLLGDNFVIAHGDKALSFPSSMNIFYYNLIPEIRNRLSSHTLLVLKLKYLLFRATLGYAKIFTPVSVKKLFPKKIVDSASPKVICLLHVADRFSADKISRSSMVKSLLYNNQMDAFPFFNYINKFALFYPDSRLAGHWRELEDNCIKFLDNIGCCYRIQLPRYINNEILKKIENLIEHA